MLIFSLLGLDVTQALAQSSSAIQDVNPINDLSVDSSEPAQVQVIEEQTSSKEEQLAAQTDLKAQRLAAQALEKFEQGKQALLHAEWTRAQDYFISALQYKKTPGLLYHLAYTEEQLEHFADAYEHYQLAAQLMKQIQAEDVKALLPAALGRVEAQVAILRITGLADSSRIVIDGRVKSALRFIAVDPGPHHLEVLSQGYETYLVEFEVEVGERLALDLKLEKIRKVGGDESMSKSNSTQQKSKSHLAESTAPSPSPQSRLPSILAISGVTMSVIGTSLLVSGVIVRQQSKKQQNILIDQLNAGGSSSCLNSEFAECEALADAYQRGKTGRALAITGGIVVAVGLTGIVSSLFLPSDAKEYSVLPNFDHQSVSLDLLGRF